MAAQRRARDDAAALAELRRPRCPAGPSPSAAQLPARAPRVCGRRAGRTCCSACCSSTGSARRRPERCGALLDRCAEAGRPEATTSTSTSRRGTRRGTSALCLVPDGDLFEAIRAGRASVVTDQIDDVPRGGSRWRPASELDADIVVTATGLEDAPARRHRARRSTAPGGAQRDRGLQGDDAQRRPELRAPLGYTNASWTLKADIDRRATCAGCSSTWTRRGYAVVHPARATPRSGSAALPRLHDRATCSARSHSFPSRAASGPGGSTRTTSGDMLALRFGRIDGGVLPLRRRTGAAL